MYINIWNQISTYQYEVLHAEYWVILALSPSFSLMFDNYIANQEQGVISCMWKRGCQSHIATGIQTKNQYIK